MVVQYPFCLGTATERFARRSRPRLMRFHGPWQLSTSMGMESPIVSAGAAAQPIVIIARDLNNDGKLDLVTVNMFSDNISVLIGNGDGSFRAAVNYTVEAASVPQALAVGDVNGDGVPDIIVGETSLFKVAVLLGNGDGTLTNHGYFSLPRYIHDVAIGDVNGDGRADLVAATNYGTTNTSFATVLLGDCSGTFGEAQDWAVYADATSG